MKAALYARVSSEEQVEGYSIDAQKRAFHALVETGVPTGNILKRVNQHIQTICLNGRSLEKLWMML